MCQIITLSKPMIVDTVKFLKHEADLDNFFTQAAQVYYPGNPLPSYSEIQKIRIALAVSDQKEGLEPKSDNPIYLLAYSIASKV